MIENELVTESGNCLPIRMWTDYVEESCLVQVRNLACLPFAFHHIALMADAHTGIGMPIGGVLAAKNVVIPNAVGVDIGCGMCAVKTSIPVADLTPEILRKKIMRGIRKRIPIGRGSHRQAQDENLMPQGWDICEMTVIQHKYKSALKQLGTLGGGNHFIELQRDTNGYLWIMIHSGSRNLGAEVGQYYNIKAESLNRQFYSPVDPAMKLAFLPMGIPEAKEYWREMEYCMAYALANRKLMMTRIEEEIAAVFPHATFDEMINICHNYAALESHFGEHVIVHRKGAVHAGSGEIGIIPGSQGTNSYIVRGLGNPESFCSSSHGAGRTMSRTRARNELSLEQEAARLDALGIIHGIRSQKDLEEASSAYKNIHTVMENQRELVEAIVELSPIAVIKG